MLLPISYYRQDKFVCMFSRFTKESLFSYLDFGKKDFERCMDLESDGTTIRLHLLEVGSARRRERQRRCNGILGL